jgi:hypothetical protein
MISITIENVTIATVVAMNEGINDEIILPITISFSLNGVVNSASIVFLSLSPAIVSAAITDVIIIGIIATKTNKMDKLSAEERKNTFNLLMSMIDSAFFILENSIGIVTKYVERFKEAKQDLSIPDHQTFLRWMKEFGVSLRFAPLSNKTFPIYEKHLKNFYSEVSSELLASELQEDLFDGDYLAWNVILPLKKALK